MEDTKYRKLVGELKDGILGGRYGAERPLPSLRALMRRSGLSSSTIRRAFAELERTGLVIRARGSGTFVAPAAASRKIGLIVPGVAYCEIYPPIVSEISRLAQEKEYRLLIGDVSGRAKEPLLRRARRVAEDLVNDKVSGVLFQPIESVSDAQACNRAVLSVFREAGVPVVLVGYGVQRTLPECGGYDVVGINNFDAGFRLAAHLSEVGARRICFLKKKGERSVSCIDRIHGIQSFLGTRRFSPDRNVLEAAADDSRAIGRYVRRRRPDAFICGNDALAATFRQTLEKLGISVPVDLLLAGFDDVNIARLTQLTSVRQPCESIARAAFGRLLERLADPRLDPAEILLAAPLAVRMSTNFVQPGS